MLPTDAKARKAIPIFSGLRKYFPLALAAVAEHSRESNDQHNPGEPLHWAREKSTDHCDCIDRHMTDYAMGDKKAMRAIAWRALAQLELDEEEALTAKLQSTERVRNGTGYFSPPQRDPGDEDPPRPPATFEKPYECAFCHQKFQTKEGRAAHVLGRPGCYDWYHNHGLQNGGL